ncbi:phosphoribosylformylglycinamidine synthase subunit PurQ [Stratiformator vulcanicus]|uniref:Phosphoribosylformylglycinamidine synthase n=1 Tax=Stratiformator vulcanicus TaxID=2527980 RepID=A0A517QZG3_9PLAN|nr:phosphoribosylformylglycinamidine synthase subunit PurQ [Stratiformator vulcanicus]QDT37036.1 Phosphoribosylformylglycinamidine synthase [Stratiformator vulcanicus]
MARPRVCILRAPGTNCDVETAYAFDSCGGSSERLHVAAILESPRRLLDFEVLCIPGGFSYGDDIGAGVIFSEKLKGELAPIVQEFLDGDRLILGICNGFQVLIRSGLLPGGAGAVGEDGRATTTLAWNDNGRFVDRWVRLAVVSDHNVFLRGLQDFEVPIAHAEGRLCLADESVLSTWKEHGQAALCYAPRNEADLPDDPLTASVPEPDNPNGSFANLAGLSDPTGRVLGLMPHPERFLFATQHPQWTRKNLQGHGAGRKIFENAISYFE